MRSTVTAAVVTALVSLCAARDARAQTFPADGDWDALGCFDHAMIDLVGDEPGAADERDLVGNLGDPTGFQASDADYLYLRLRLEDDPTDAAGDLRSFAWGVEVDLDDDLTTYEVLIRAGGLDQAIAVYTNDAVTQPDDPADPADLPPYVSYAWADNGEAVDAGTDFGGDGADDFFLDLAVPWADLDPLGVPDPLDVVWAGSSSQDDRLDADLACHDGRTGDPTLSEIVTDTDGDGFSDADETAAGTDPNDPNDTPDGTIGGARLEGGGGCAAGGGRSPAGGGACLLALCALAFVSAAGRARDRGRRCG